MRYLDAKCDYLGTQGANHTEPITVQGGVEIAYLSDEAWNLMMQLGGQLRNGQEGADDALSAFWNKVLQGISERKRIDRR